MKECSSEYRAWLKYADDDLMAAKHLLKTELFNQVCFHCHQAVEKLLKAFLIRHEVNPPRIHNLNTLLNICAKKDPKLLELRQEVLALDMYYIPTRYPNAPIGSLHSGLPNKKDAETALAIARKIRERV
jgi:HEPN domain-containing protein